MFQKNCLLRCIQSNNDHSVVEQNCGLFKYANENLLELSINSNESAPGAPAQNANRAHDGQHWSSIKKLKRKFNDSIGKSRIRKVLLASHQSKRLYSAATATTTTSTPSESKSLTATKATAVTAASSKKSKTTSSKTSNTTTDSAWDRLSDLQMGARFDRTLADTRGSVQRSFVAGRLLSSTVANASALSKLSSSSKSSAISSKSRTDSRHIASVAEYYLDESEDFYSDDSDDNDDDDDSDLSMDEATLYDYYGLGSCVSGQQHPYYQQRTLDLNSSLSSVSSLEFESFETASERQTASLINVANAAKRKKYTKSAASSRQTSAASVGAKFDPLISSSRSNIGLPLPAGRVARRQSVMNSTVAAAAKTVSALPTLLATPARKLAFEPHTMSSRKSLLANGTRCVAEARCSCSDCCNDNEPLCCSLCQNEEQQRCQADTSCVQCFSSSVAAAEVATASICQLFDDNVCSSTLLSSAASTRLRPSSRTASSTSSLSVSSSSSTSTSSSSSCSCSNLSSNSIALRMSSSSTSSECCSTANQSVAHTTVLYLQSV